MFHPFTKRRSEAEPGAVETSIRVKDGFHPDTVRAVAGRPVRITFRREETSPCSERVIFPAFGEARALPPGEDVTVELLPERAGELEFTCEMGMLRGRLIVDPPTSAPKAAAAAAARTGTLLPKGPQ